MKSIRFAAGGAAGTVLAGLLAMPASAQPPAKYATGSDRTYVHRINLIDESGNVIGPDSKVPYSPARTCAKCHDYERISMGRHFQEGFPGIVDGRPAEPWILWDAATRTQVPISHRVWAQATKRQPSDFGLTTWEFALVFGRHHPGGGMLEWLSEGQRRDASDESEPGCGPGSGGPALGPIPQPQWKRTGPLSIDCLACHLNGGYSNGNRWYYLHTELNFRGAAALAAGLGTSRANVKDQIRLEKDYLADTPNWTPYLAKDPGIRYDPARFDPDGRVYLDLTRRPPARNCLYCHASRVPGVIDRAMPAHDLDVHLAAGMTCTDCHRNGLDHEIVRGDGSPQDHSEQPASLGLSCRGCHEAGRLGAPRIEHYGLPAFHLDRIACTTCHAGPLPSPEIQLLQTARAHALGLKTFLNLDVLARPAVQAPVYKKDGTGVIRPHAAIWPAWWAVPKDGALVPLPLQQAREVIAIVRTALQEREMLDIRIQGEKNWIEAERKKGRTPPEDEVTSAGLGAVAVWQEQQKKAREDAEKSGWEKALQEIRQQAAAKGRRVIEDEVRNALDTVRAGLNRREDDERWKKDLPLILKCLAAKEKADKEKKDLVALLPPSGVQERTDKDGKKIPKTLDAERRDNLISRLEALPLESSYLYISGGKVFHANGKVEDRRSEAQPHFWPIAHNVRGAGAALGAKGCSDCHGVRAPFFFGIVKAQPAGPGGEAAAIRQHTYMGLSGIMTRMGSLSVVLREAFMKRIGTLLVVGLLGLALLHYLVIGRRAIAGVAGEPAAGLPLPPELPAIAWTRFCALALFVGLAATGAGFLATYGPSPIIQICTSRGVIGFHAIGGIAFAALAAILALLWIGAVVSNRAEGAGNSGGLLWISRLKDRVVPARRAMLWIGIDVVCILALAVTGLILLGRLPTLGGRVHLLARLADHRFIGPMAYAIHGAAGCLMMLRLAGHVYAALVLRKR